VSWHTFDDEYKVYISPDEGVLEVRHNDTEEPAPDSIGDLVAWAVGVGQRIGLESAKDRLLYALIHDADSAKLYAARCLLDELQRELYTQAKS